MPEMDGRDVLVAMDEMVSNGKISKRPVVIMMTAYAAEPMAQELGSTKVFALLQKPFKSSALFNEIVAAFCEAPEHNAVQELSTTDNSELRGVVLLVEDNLINQQVACELLRSGGYDVDVAENGKVALAMVAEKTYDAVLMDIQMPVMDGLTATRELRKQYSMEQLPIIAMTAHAMSGDKDKSLEAGMNAHITKPIMLNELFETLSHWIHKA
jgi:CheY-like chemotaxis protein